MAYSNDLHKLILSHTELIEAIPQVLNITELRLFRKINNYIEDRIGNEKGWQGDYECVSGKNEETYFCPNSWTNKDKFRAWYELTPSDEDELEWISYATGVQEKTLCLEFVVETDHVNLTYEQYLPELRKFYNNSAKLKDLGFKFDPIKEAIIYPFSFDGKKLATNFPNNLEKAFIPLKKALDNLFEAHEEFDTFIGELPWTID